MNVCYCMLPMLPEKSEAVVIRSEDMDIFIMAVAFHDKAAAKFFQRCDTKTQKRLVDIKKLKATNILGMNVSRALIGMHAYTGCNTVHAFAGKGKVKPLKLLTNDRLC